MSRKGTMMREKTRSRLAVKIIFSILTIATIFPLGSYEVFAQSADQETTVSNKLTKITFDSSSTTYNMTDEEENHDDGAMPFSVVAASGDTITEVDYSDGYVYNVVSSDPSIAVPYIDEEDGQAKVYYRPYKCGTCVITLTIDGVSSSFTLSVKHEESDTTIRFDENNKTVISYPSSLPENYTDSSYAITLHVYSGEESPRWYVSDKSIASVSQLGDDASYVTLTPHKQGTVTVSCHVGSTILKQKIRIVEPTKVKNIEFDLSGGKRNRLYIAPGKSEEISFTTKFIDGSREKLYNAKYYLPKVKSSNNTIASVEINAKKGVIISAKKTGECDITVTIGGCVRTIHVYVRVGAVSSFITDNNVIVIDEDPNSTKNSSKPTESTTETEIDKEDVYVLK